MNNLYVGKKLSHKELYEMFIKVNNGVKVINYQPLLGDECEVYAMKGQPIIRVDLENSWLRVFISKENGEINWY